jgi:ABC-type branched-subunit amino acid transport system substrate-binding protein
MRSQHEEVREESLLDTTKRESEMPTGLHLNAALFSTALLATALATTPASAQKKYDTGATDTEIKIGNTIAYSGPASNYGTIAKAEAAYFNKINAEGGINGRKINFISYDDAYSPPKTVEQTHKLVESDEVFVDLAPLGTASNVGIQKYLNQKKVPQLFVGSGASRWGDPEHFPWTIGLQPSYRSEARIYATYILQNYPGKTIGILYQNDDFGKDYLVGLKDVLKDKYEKLVVSEMAFEVSMPTVDSQIVAIRTANPDIFINIGTPKFAAQAIKKIAEMDWHPIHIMTNVSISPAQTLKPAGIENATGILSSAYQMIVTDPAMEATPGMKKFRAFMEKYFPEADKSESGPLTAWNAGQVFVQLIKQCGDELTRENVMKQAANLDMTVDTYLPGIRVKTSATDFYPIEQLQMIKFNGRTWETFGPMIDSHQE